MATTTISPPALSKTISVIKGHPIWGMGLEFRKDPVRVFLGLREKYGDVFCMKVFVNTYFYIVMHPEGYEHILRANQKNYEKPAFFLNTMKKLTGQGLVTNEGENWRTQRRLISPTFNRNNLAFFVAEITNVANELAQSWEKLAEQKAIIDLQTEMTTLTLQIASRTLFSSDIIAKADAVGNAARECLQYVAEGLMNPISVHQHLPTKKQKQFYENKKLIYNVLGEMIRERKDKNIVKNDLMGMLLAARDEETQQGMSEEQLLDELMSMIIGGHETTSAALTWSYYLLSLHPEKEAKLLAELAPFAGKDIDFQDHTKLLYTNAVFQEAMRMYPPAWGTTRVAVADDEIEGYKIPAGATMFLPFWATNFNDEIWDNPSVFSPERFLPENSGNRHKYAFLPFGAGMRQCVGNHFATLEAILVLANLTPKFRMELIANQVVEHDTGFALRTKNGIKMRLIKRQ